MKKVALKDSYSGFQLEEESSIVIFEASGPRYPFSSSSSKAVGFLGDDSSFRYDSKRFSLFLKPSQIARMEAFVKTAQLRREVPVRETIDFQISVEKQRFTDEQIELI